MTASRSPITRYALPARCSRIERDVRRRHATWATRCAACAVAVSAILAGYANDARPAIAAEEARAESSVERRAKALRLVEQLGDDRFDIREQATTSLLKMGLSARAELEQATRHLDREVRYRAERILLIVRKIDLEQRLDAFIEEVGKPGDYDLPAWPLVKKELGDKKETRRLFALMVRSEPELLSALERGKQPVFELLPMRVQEIQVAQQFGTSGPTVGTLAASLLAANITNAESNPQVAQMVYSLCYQQSLRASLTSGEYAEIMRTLLGNWIQRGDDILAYQGVQIAIQYDMKEGLVPAVKCLKNANMQAQLRQYAILFVAKMGDESHRELLEKLLEDKSPCGTWQLNNVNLSTQLRDVALVTLITLEKKDPKQFGFLHLQPSSPYIFAPMSAGFESEEKRTKAFEKWREFRATQTNKPPAPKNE